MGIKDFVGEATEVVAAVVCPGAYLGYKGYKGLKKLAEAFDDKVRFFADSVREFRLVKGGVEFNLSADDLSADLEEVEGGILVTLRGGAQLAISEKFLNCPFDIEKISPRGRTAEEWSDAIEESSSIAGKITLLEQWAEDINFSSAMLRSFGGYTTYCLDVMAISMRIWAANYAEIKSNVKNKKDTERVNSVRDKWEDALISLCRWCISQTLSPEVGYEYETVADSLLALSILVKEKNPFLSYEIGRTLVFYWGKTSYDPIAKDGVSRSIYSLLDIDEENDTISGPLMTDYARREILVCTDEPCSLDALEKSIPKVLCMSEADVKCYNEILSEVGMEDDKWKFEIGHPRNGVTYIQHPHEKNTYYTLETFHSSMLERKHEELMSLLQALGATRVMASVTHSDGRTEKQRAQLDVGGGYKGGFENVGVGVSGKYNSSTSSADEEHLYHRLAQSMVFNETMDEPYIPDDLYFYQYEKKWQQIAKAVLNKCLRECEVTLEYSNDYSINKQRVKKIEADLQYMIHSFNMNIGSEFEESLSQKTSMIWYYKVEFGSPKTKVVDAEVLPVVSTVKHSVSRSKPTVASVSVDLTKGERLFLKHAKRYIQNDGKLDAEERADLEMLAKKFGIDKFRFEELIEEAFDEG